jgi:hypothetical protein
MLSGYGWCVLRSSRDPYRGATVDSVDAVDELVEVADAALWHAFRQWMNENEDMFLKWELCEQNDNDYGILLFTVSSNHRSSSVWNMMSWIAENGPGSYGLFYTHDDEDQIGHHSYGRGQHDFRNEFRVHRIANGQVTEFADPFLSPIVPTLSPNELA